MKKFKRLQGFIMGFLVCAILGTTITYADDIYQNISVMIGSMNISINGRQVELDNLLYDGRTYVPLRAYSELMGKVVGYDGATSQITVDDKSAVHMLSKDIAFLVNGQPVRVDYFTQLINWYKLNSGIKEIPQEDREDFKEFVRNEVTGFIITEQFATQLGISLSMEDQKTIDSKIDIFAGIYGGMDSFIAVLKDNGITFEVYRSMQENAAIRSKLLDVITEQITDNELMAYYEKTKESYRVDKVKVKHILLKTIDENEFPFSELKKGDIKTDAVQILKHIKDGSISFDDAVKRFSQDTAMIANPEGYYISRGETVVAFEKAAFSMNIGDVSDIIESEVGFHIINIIDKTTLYKPFETVSDNIYNILRNESYHQTIDPLIGEAEIILNDSIYDSI